MSDVVQAFPGLPENPLKLENPPGGSIFCQHEAVRINKHDRTLHCAKCNAALDPFDFVLHGARTIQRAWESHKQVGAMVSELNDRVAFLKKEEKRLRDMVKRLQAKTGEVVHVRGKEL